MNRNLSPRRRALSLLLALSLILGLLPGAALAAEPGNGASAEAAPAGHWAASYLNQMVEWGFIRADQAENPDRQLTRADFMSIVNRAYGYDEVGPTPFQDVSEYDWFYDDVGIAYTARYINGTSPTTASPNDTLDRETAATILGRNMMLQESAGEILDFSDARDISNWARGTIKSSMEHYLVSGYDDGTFRPQQAMSWGEIAALVTRTIGTPLQDEGDYALGGVFGNVTVTSPGVTLRDTVISGDLYVTGGVGLGGIKLENVTVLGRIIASGTGTSEGGASILLRNVTADELLVDNLQDKEVSIQADGITEIGKTTVRSSAYIEDNTPEGLGLHAISLEGDFYGEDEEPPEGWTPPRLTLAGRIEEVVNRTPNSTVEAAKGTVAKLTVDETAEGSNVVIDRGAVVKDLVLDTGVDVSGEGDITRLEVNAPGCTVEMLPDQIVIRPGIIADIAGEEMDSASADEFLLEPMILSGYPKAQDIAPTSLEAVFATNKKGRIYWAVSAVTDGSIGADDLLKPPSYGNKALRWGTVDSPRGNEETIAKITGLTADGSYYLSAVLEDARGKLSPVKVISFTTPDNTVPAFNKGYPYMSLTSRANSQAVVSVNKACVLYYALYPEGVTAPTINDLKTGSVAGSLGYGTQTLEKNTEMPIQVNNRTLEEQKNYVVYFWLTDANGANSSAISSLTFTTADETLPYFLQGYPRVTSTQRNSVTLTFRINENGRVFWVVRPEGDTTYPLPKPGQSGTASLDDLFAKTQVASENPAINAVANTDGRIVINGLEPEKAYDLYYLCQDTAGNYSLSVEKMTIRTQDTNGPRVIGQYFDSFSGTDNTKNPKADTAIDLVFSENVCSSGDIQKDFLSLYKETKTAADRNQALDNMAKALQQSITLEKKNESGEWIKQTSYLDDMSQDKSKWVIDYSKAEITLDNGQLTVRFPDEAVTLESGGVYRFVISKLTDNSTPTGTNKGKNPLEDENGNKVDSVTLPEFAVGFPSLALSKDPGLEDGDEPQKRELSNGAKVWEKNTDGSFMLDNSKKKIPVSVDMDTSLYFRMTPDSTDDIDEKTAYDILLWNQQNVSYQLYYRILDRDSEDVVTAAKIGTNGLDPLITEAEKDQGDEDDKIDANGWVYLGKTSLSTRNKEWQARSVNKHINGCGRSQFPKLQTLSEDLTYEFVISLYEVGQETDPTAWSDPVTFRAQVVAGASQNLDGLAVDVKNFWDQAIKDGLNGGAAVICEGNKEGEKEGKYLEWTLPVQDKRIPIFTNRTPQFPRTINNKEALTDQMVTMQLALDRPDTTIYWVLAKKDEQVIPTVPATITREVIGPDGNPVVGPDGNPVMETVRNPVADATATPTNGTLPLDPSKIPTGGDKTPDGKPAFKLASPTADEIYDPTTNMRDFVSSSNLYGDVSYNGQMISHVVGPDTDQKLEPSTTYYAYFVLKGRYSEKSEVYIYQFTTPETSRPRIQSQDAPNKKPYSDGDVIVRTHVASRGYYRAVTQTAALGKIDILKAPFSAHCYSAKELEELSHGAFTAPSTGGGTPPCYTKNDADGVFTVLDALRTGYLESNAELRDYKNNNQYYIFPETRVGYTVFDKYADEDTRKDVYDVIMNLDPSVSRGVTGPLQIGPSKGTGVNDWSYQDVYTELDENDEDRYFLLTYAVNQNTTLLDGEEYKEASFNAHWFGRTNLEPVEVDYVQMSLDNDTGGNYKGEITVYFRSSTLLHNNTTTIGGGLAQDMTRDNILESKYGHAFKPFAGSNMVITAYDPTFFTIRFSEVNCSGSSTDSNFASRYFANADNKATAKPLIFTMTKNQTTGEVKLVATWGGAEVGSATLNDSAPPTDQELIFTGDSRLSYANKVYTVKLDGDASPAPDKIDLTGTLNGAGTIVNATVKPQSGAVANATVSVSSGEISLTFTAKGIGTETFEVQANVENPGGGYVTISRTFTVNVDGTLSVKSFAPTIAAESSIEVDQQDATQYTWERNDNKSTKAATLIVKAPFAISPSTVYNVTSDLDASLHVVSKNLNASGELVITLEYKNKSTSGAVPLRITVGSKTLVLMVILAGASDGGDTFAGIQPKPTL